MIYLDHAATSWPKPPEVLHAMIAAMAEAGGNPGRSGHSLSLRASDVVYDCREGLAALFGINDPLRIAFTANATEALNLAIKGLLKPGDHAVYSSMEHNAVWRPLKAMECHGVSLTMVEANSEGGISPQSIAASLRPNTRLVVLTHASNVTGTINDIAAIGALLKERSVPFLVDAAQTAGVLPINVAAMAIDMLAFPGHKGLLGPQGTGGLYVGEGLSLRPLKDGGTGTTSHLAAMPDITPDRYESGTLNTPGIAGLNAGVRHILAVGQTAIRAHEVMLITQLQKGLSSLPGVTIYGPHDPARRMGILSLTVDGFDCEELAAILEERFSIACRAGLTCAPLAHATIGTTNTGVLRFSVGHTTSENDIATLVSALHQVIAA